PRTLAPPNRPAEDYKSRRAARAAGCSGAGRVAAGELRAGESLPPLAMWGVAEVKDPCSLPMLSVDMENKENGSVGVKNSMENGRPPDPADWAVMDVVNYFRTAGFEEQASAFQEQVHPDKTENERVAEEKFKQLAEVHMVLENRQNKNHLKEALQFERSHCDFQIVFSSGGNFSTDCVGRARKCKSFCDVNPIMDTGFSTFVYLGSNPSPSSGTFVAFVSSRMGNFRVVTTCSQIMNGKRVVNRKF
ncbi:Sterile alpha motif domain-containing protein 13, partial [Galemys pyrenaicus]